MKTKRIITEKDAKMFFNTKINSIEDAMGICDIDVINKQISFDFTSVLLLSFKYVLAEQCYSIDSTLFTSNFTRVLNQCITNKIEDSTEYDYVRNLDSKQLHFTFKLEKADNENVRIYIINIEKLKETEKELALLGNVLDSSKELFVGSTWWKDYDKHHHHFYQTDAGPKILGIDISKNKLYGTTDFQKVREKARVSSPFYDECIKTEEESFEKMRKNETDYFAGRTPAQTFNGETVWVEAYGKCLLRYKDGTPRFFVAIDIYLSDVFESSHQLTIINNLVNTGLINSDVGIWYYQKHIEIGRYYFTKSYRSLMNISEDYESETASDILNEHFDKVIIHTPSYLKFLNNFKETHNKIFDGEIDKYEVVIPNNFEKDKPQWIEIRGTVIERDLTGDVILFVGVAIDITQFTLRNQELERLRVQNERLQLAEKLAIKAGNVIVWYQSDDLINDNNHVYGNDMFVQKLGIKRNSEGIIKLKDIRRTMCFDTLEAKEYSRILLSQLDDIYTLKIKSLKHLLVKHKNYETGEEFYFEHSIEVEEFNEDGSIKLIGGFMLDVTENMKRQEQIRFLANYDVLSQLHNRNYFDGFINSDKMPSSYTILLFDIDGLKLVNDAFGHIEGDKIIKILASFLKEVYSDNLFIARIGGDEFVIVQDFISLDRVSDQVDELEAVIDKHNETAHIKLIVSKGGKEVIDNDLSFEKAFTIAENLMYRRKLNNRSSRKSHALESIIETLNAKTEETKEHSERMSSNALKTLVELGLSRASEKADIRLLARVHDIGKITVPDNILFKKGRLDQSEFEIIKKHCEAGYKIIKNITDSDNVSEGVLSHHEHYDGSGYPQGLVGENIHIYARIICVIDAYDAMTNLRVYQKTKTQDEAIKEIIRCSGTQFDPKVVKAFLKSCFEIDLEMNTI